jgi:hypothetical protein
LIALFHDAELHQHVILTRQTGDADRPRVTIDADLSLGAESGNEG